jgi:rfaE bifunctional protein nucleotidyltransferase chain/domain
VAISHPCRSVKSKIVDRAALTEAVQVAKERGETVVLTNGCFDILHIGHVRYLANARALGDLLVVAVNTDEGVRRLKGPDRPVVPQSERLEVLASLECIDYVTLFDEPTPIETILAIKPSIHVKGGDYKADNLIEGDAVREVGAQVRIVAFETTETEGKSTTNLIGRIVGREG